MNYRKIIYVIILMSLWVIIGCEENPLEPEEEEIKNPISGTITENTTWETGQVYLVDGGLNISGATLTIQPGTRIEFKSDADIDIEEGGAIVAQGTGEQPILFTSHNQTAQKGYWKYISITKNANISIIEFNNCIFEYGGGSSAYPGMLNIDDGGAIKLSNSIFRNSKTNGIYLRTDGKFTICENNTITGCDDAPIRIDAKQVHTIGAGNYSGNTKDRIHVYGSNLTTQNVTWKNLNISYFIERSFDIKGIILTIEAGTELQLGSQVDIDIVDAGGLIAKGTETERIVFTSENRLTNQGYWKCLYFGDNDITNSIFENCDFSYGGGSAAYPGMLYLNDTKISLVNCQFVGSGGPGIYLSDDAEFNAFDGNTVSESIGPVMQIPAQAAGTLTALAAADNIKNYIEIIHSKAMSSSNTWQNHRVPYLISSPFNIETVTWTIMPGVEIQLGADVDLDVENGGAIIAVGTADYPIRFTSENRVANPGYWKYLYFGNSDWNQTEIAYCIFEYGGGSSAYPGMIHLAKGDNPNIYSSTFQSSGNYGIYITRDGNINQKAIYSVNNIFIGNASGDVFLVSD